MFKFELLSTEDLKYICNHVPSSTSRLYFQKNPKSFAEIKPGFRPEKLSDADIFTILSRNANKPFIFSFLEKMVSDWLSQIQANCDRLVDEGCSTEEALLTTISESVFCDNCELYFKLIEGNPSVEYLQLFREAMLQMQRAAETKVSEEQLEEAHKDKELMDKANNTINELREQLNERKASESSICEQLSSVEAQLTLYKNELDSLKVLLQEAEAYRSEMQAELERYRRLNSFSDGEYVQDDFVEFQHISIGQVYCDHSGQRWINRLADVIKGEIIPFSPDEGSPHHFDNRDRLFWKDGYGEDGSLGIWSWRADPNYSDPTKDYVTSEYYRDSKITEVVEFPQCKNLAEVAYLIAEWFERSFRGEKVLFICNTASGTMEGILCSPGSMEFKGDKARLLASVFMLPHYSVKPSDIIKIAGRRIHRKMSLGIPQSVFRVRTPYDVVKKMLLSRVTISALREYELSKKEAQICKHYLESIPTDTIIQELSDAYACTESEAKEYVDGFIEHAGTYLSDNDFDINTVSLALARNSELIELCKKQLSGKWEEDNAGIIEDARKRLAFVEQNESVKRSEISELTQKKEELSSKIQQLQRQIKETEQLANDVEMKTAARIQEAQQNVAEFISHMAFVVPTVNSGIDSEKSQHQTALPIFRSIMDHTDAGLVDDIDTFEEELTENLVIVGYKEEIAVEMAQAISFSICNRLPLVIGDYSTVLAQCLAATIGGEQLTEVFIANQPTVISCLYELIDRNRTEHPLVYLVHGVFDGYSNNLFKEISNLMRRPAINAVIIISLQGISPNMVFESVWNGAIYIDGDSGLERFSEEPVHAFKPTMVFNRVSDKEEFNTKRKALQPFAPILSNLQICWYARYLGDYGIGLNESPTILNQVITVGRSSGSEEKLNTLFRENGINNGEKMLEKYL